jgi:hypothetical protein
LNVLPPVVGSRIVGFGYHSSKISLGVETPEQITVEWFDSPATTVGEVIEIHHKQRDSSMLPFPCFQTNARFEHGMSGGPVFNESGELCGLICSGFPPDDNTYTSYAVSIWPALGTELDLPYEGFLRGAKYSCLELARRNIITANGWERVNLESPTRVSLRQPFSLSAVLQKAVENPS